MISDFPPPSPYYFVVFPKLLSGNYSLVDRVINLEWSLTLDGSSLDTSQKYLPFLTNSTVTTYTSHYVL